MNGWLLSALVYALVFLAIQIVVRIALRSEPTAHGQIVGRVAAFWVGLLWPPLLLWVAIVGIAMGAVWLGRRARGSR